VVIGFVVSYHMMSGYDRYWMGRTAGTNVIRNAHTMARLIWYHVPLCLTPNNGSRFGGGMSFSSLPFAPTMAFDFVFMMVWMVLMLTYVRTRFAVSLKHHLCSELGIYYKDLYDLVIA
ncbi:hypothetical protein DFH08DRAFT_710244, partial [Mycena albidolilacea]